MCLICIDLAKRALRAAEGRRALDEMRGSLDREHVAEVEAKIADAEKAEQQPAPPPADDPDGS